MTFSNGSWINNDAAGLRPASPVPEPIRHPFVKSPYSNTPPTLYKFQCWYYCYGHDSYEFVWDGARNPLDRASVERANAYDLLISGQVRCRCGQSVQQRGAEYVYATEPVSNEKSREKELDERIKALEAALKEMQIQSAPRVMIGNAKDELPPPSQVASGTLFVTSKGELFIKTHDGERDEWMLIGATSMAGMTDAEIDELKIRLGLKQPQSAAEAIKAYMDKIKADPAPTTPTSSTEKTEPSMTDPVNPPKPTIARRVIDTVKSDSADAAWRVAGNQLVRLARDPLIAKLSENMAPGDPATRIKIAAFLSTEFGEAVLAGVLALGLEMMPKKIGVVPGRLAQELRVKAFAASFDVLAEMVTKPVRDLISSGLLDEAIASLPQELPDGVRLPTDTVNSGEAIGVKTKEGEAK